MTGDWLPSDLVTAGDGLTVRASGDSYAVLDARPRGFWGRLTAEPRAGWYSWRAVAPQADGTWQILPAEPPWAFGTADASDPAKDSLPARGANGEAGLPTGEGDAGRVVWLEFDPVLPGWRFGGGGGGGGGLVVVLTAEANGGATTANPSGAWTGATLVGPGSRPVQVQPVALSGRLAPNERYAAFPAGQTGPAPQSLPRYWAITIPLLTQTLDAARCTATGLANFSVPLVTPKV